MNETMGSIIMRLRKDKGLTQEQLANALGISYQAVSKWETGNSCPDIAALPLLADLFGVSIDALFDRTPAEAEASAAPEPAAAASLPWPDDDAFYAVLYHGHELIDSQMETQRRFRFQYEGPAQDLNCAFDLEITGTVYGDVTAGGDVSCDNVAGDVRANGDVSCDNVAGSVTAGGDVSCDNVDGNVTAGGGVSCDEIAGSAFAGTSFRSDHLDLDMSGCLSDRTRESADAAERLGEELAEKLGNLSAWGAELGRRVAETVERNLRKQGGFSLGWTGGKRATRADRDERSDDREEE